MATEPNEASWVSERVCCTLVKDDEATVVDITDSHYKLSEPVDGWCRLADNNGATALRPKVKIQHSHQAVAKAKANGDGRRSNGSASLRSPHHHAGVVCSQCGKSTAHPHPQLPPPTNPSIHPLSHMFVLVACVHARHQSFIYEKGFFSGCSGG